MCKYSNNKKKQIPLKLAYNRFMQRPLQDFKVTVGGVIVSVFVEALWGTVFEGASFTLYLVEGGVAHCTHG